MMNRKFVIDTNTLVSALLFENSKPTLAYNKARELGKIVASLETYDEVCEVLVRPKFDKYLPLPTRLEIIEELKDVFSFQEVSIQLTDCRDRKDNKFLELAVAANAACIITGDEDLLVLHPFHGIPILKAADFLNNFSIF